MFSEVDYSLWSFQLRHLRSLAFQRKFWTFVCNVAVLADLSCHLKGWEMMATSQIFFISMTRLLYHVSGSIIVNLMASNQAKGGKDRQEETEKGNMPFIYHTIHSYNSERNKTLDFWIFDSTTILRYVALLIRRLDNGN